MPEAFNYEKSLKTNPDDSFLNLQSYLYIGSKTITKLFFYTPITPHQVILLSLLFGVAASYLIIQNNIMLVIIGAVLLFYKNVLDKVDGSLARAKGLDSRRGRFYDSISDAIVTLTTFLAMSYKLYLSYNSIWVFAVGFAAMIFSMLQCSYFIFYQVSFIKLSGKQTVNRLIESVTDDDVKSQDGWTVSLQRLFMLIYGWQDKIFASVDNHFFKQFEMKAAAVIGTKNNSGEIIRRLWYGNKLFLTMASSLSIGTHILFICIFSLASRFDVYFAVNLILWNLLLICCIVYHNASSKRLLSTLKN